MDLLPFYLVVAAIAFLGVALALVDPILVLWLAVPGVLVFQRVGGSGLNLSGSDFLTTAAAALALPLLRSDMRATRRLLWIAIAFEALLFLAVVVHPNAKGILEWLHRLVLVGGAIAVGGVIGRSRRATGPVLMFLAATAVLGVIATGWTVAHGLEPASPFGMAKNFVGSMMASALIIAVLRPSWLQISRGWLAVIGLLCSVGLIASQSRGAMLALAVALVVASTREGRIGRRGAFALIAVTPLVAYTVVSLLHESDQLQENSLTYRAGYSALAFREWHLSPVFGQGLRFFNEPGALLQSDAHNVVATTLAESGVVGLIALAVLIGSALFALWRLPPEIGAIAVAFVAARFVHGLFDIYWVAATTTLPWLIVGMACGTADADAAEHVPGAAPPPQMSRAGSDRR